MTPQTPPTDRPLTAGDVPLLREGDLVAPVADLTDYRGGKLLAGVPVPVLNVSSDGYIRVTDPERGHLSYAFTFVSRPATSAASEGEGVNALVKELRLAACGLFELKNDRGDYGYFDTIADRLAALATPPVSERERELEGALRNLLGAFDTPVARRRLPPTDFSRAAIDQARALTAQPAGEGK